LGPGIGEASGALAAVLLAIVVGEVLNGGLQLLDVVGEEFDLRREVENHHEEMEFLVDDRVVRVADERRLFELPRGHGGADAVGEFDLRVEQLREKLRRHGNRGFLFERKGRIGC